MPRSVAIAQERWPLARPFAISRGVKTAAEVVICTVIDGPHRGLGECVPYARYGETVSSVVKALEGIAPSVGDGLDRARLHGTMPPGAARNALDCALWDLEAKIAGMPVWRLARLPRPKAALTAFTISLDTPEAMGLAAAEAAKRPLLKLKLGADDPVACTAAVRAAAPDARLIADANEGWTADQLVQIAPELAQLGVELIEQPVPVELTGMLAGWQSPLTLCADESFHVASDITPIQELFGAVNIKLDKAGGLTEAIRCVHAAQRAGLKIMVGCMVATSLAMAPAALLASAADYVDLDGPLLLKADRLHGFEFDGSLMLPGGSKPVGLTLFPCQSKTALDHYRIKRIIYIPVQEKTPMQQKKTWAKPKAVETAAAMEINCYVSCTLSRK